MKTRAATWAGERLCDVCMAGVWLADRPTWLLRRLAERIDTHYADRVNPRWER